MGAFSRTVGQERSMLDVRGLGKGGFFVIAGPCVIEGDEFLMSSARAVKEAASSAGVPLVFKSSFDKANRTSVSSFRGPGLERGLQALARVRRELDLPVLTDVHDPREAEAAGPVVDVLQVPAFLARQTDLVMAAARHGKAVNVKKGQFMSPAEMEHVAAKVARAEGTRTLWLTERGTTFGYNDLVVDFRSIPVMKRTGCPVVFDATHSVQRPAGQGSSSGGTREHVAMLARAAVAAGADALFLEVHPDPDRALSDAATQIDPALFGTVLKEALAVRKALGL
jgi:2-dehydro-3-deoxyphosphooctonate aldolase (KDO 8-P synthase)